MNELVEKVCNSAKKAGEAILQYYKSENFKIHKKEDASPVTEADWKSHEILVEHLSSFSSHEIISEESFQEGDPIPQNEPMWLLDPLDGTKEFIKRTGDFSVNVALIEGKFPILGVIYIPLSDELFYSYQGEGSFKKSKEGTVKLQTKSTNLEDLHFLISRSNVERVQTKIHQKWPTAKSTPMGASVRYCRLAEGKADLYLAGHNTYEWDTAAAQCILEEAGGKICDSDGKRLTYRKKHLLNTKCAAFADRNIAMDTFF